MMLCPRRILWRSRGFNLDYHFLLTPEIPYQKDWYNTFIEMFAGLNANLDPITKGGVLHLGNQEYIFYMSTFIHPLLKDESGRPITEYIVYFPDCLGPPGSTINVPQNWTECVVEFFSPIRLATFHDQTNKSVKCHVEQLLRDMTTTKIYVPGGMEPVILSRLIRRPETSIPRTRSQSLSRKSRTTSWLYLTALVLLVVTLIVAALLIARYL